MQKTIERLTCARIPTESGEFQLCYYRNGQDDKEHLALVVGDVTAVSNVLVRVHSECFTGDVLGSLRCDCGPQLQQAIRLIAQEGRGILIYLRQEGRGIGLLDKLRAYNLQDEGYDTVEANLMLGHQADARDYTVAALILQDLGIRSLRLLTNNPAKMSGLQALGITVKGRVPLQTAVNLENEAYLRTKVERMQHLLNLDTPPLWPTLNGHNEQHLFQDSVANDNGRCRVTLSYAQSLDGAITIRRGESTALSGPESRIMTHRLRAQHDAILIGIGTVLADDPRLTVRLVEGIDPQAIIVDSHLRLPLTARLLQNERPPWIATTQAADPLRVKAVQATGARIVMLPANEKGRVSLTALLNWLKQAQMNSVMVEGGAEIISSFLQQQLVDQLVLTITPRWLGGLNALVGGSSHLPQLKQPMYQQLGHDLILSGLVGRTTV